MEFRNQRFEDTTVDLDGNAFVGCTFTRCKLRFRGTAPPSIMNCSFNSSGWAFDGAAGLTVEFLHQMFHGGLSPLVEETIAQIRRPKGR
jgi:hypothetical protein